MITFTVACSSLSVSAVSSTPAGQTILGIWARASVACWVTMIIILETGVPSGVEVIHSTASLTSWMTVVALVVCEVLVIVTAIETESYCVFYVTNIIVWACSTSVSTSGTKEVAWFRSWFNGVVV